jgi:hypothetical protein
MKYPITTQKDVRKEFWWLYSNDHKKVPGWTQNDYPTDTRVAFCDFVESLQRNNKISEALAQRATL